MKMAQSEVVVITSGAVLQHLADSLEIVYDQLKDDSIPTKRIEDFKKEEFWNLINGTVKLVSHEATKLCMMFSKPPTPTLEESQKLTNSLEGACLALLSAFCGLPKCYGRTLHKDVRLAVMNILQAVKYLCVEAKDQSCCQLQCIGNVWEKCNDAERIPRDDKGAVTALLHGQITIVQDALEELQDNIRNEELDHEEGGGEEEEVHVQNGYRLPLRGAWTDADRQLLPSCTGLIKTAKACLRKTTQTVSSNGHCDTFEFINQLDELAALATSTSALVDDFVLSVYPPMVQSAVRRNASGLADHIRKLLSTVRNSHICTEDDKSWINFLERAVTHNFGKIADLALED